MTDNKKVMQQALDAMLGYKPHSRTHTTDMNSAFSALRKAIAQPEQPAPVRQPLTDTELSEIMEKVNFTYNPTLFARAVEAAHGIAQPEQPAQRNLTSQEQNVLHKALRKSGKVITTIAQPKDKP